MTTELICVVINIINFLSYPTLIFYHAELADAAEMYLTFILKILCSNLSRFVGYSEIFIVFCILSGRILK
jgi:hypothetical protein